LVSLGRRRFLPLIGFAAAVVLAIPLRAAGLRLSEVMPVDTGLLPDEDAEYTGWIEIENTGSEAVGLNRVGLSNDPGQPFRWTFPDLTLPPGGRLVVFASGKNRSDPAGLPQLRPDQDPPALSVTEGLGLWLDAAQQNTFVLDGTWVAEWRDRSGQRFDFTDPPSTSPSQFPDLVLWLDASIADDVLLNQGAVQQWNDRSASGAHAQQDTPARRPVTVQDSRSGLPMLRFDGANDRLELATPTAGQTILWVGAEDAAAALGYGTVVGDSKGIRWDRGRLGCLYLPTDGGGVAAWTSAVRYNGEMVDPVLTPLPRQTVVVTTVTSTRVAVDTIGSARGPYGTFWQGNVAEVIVFDRVLSPDEYGAIEAYLIAKWNPPRPPRQGYRQAAQDLPESRPRLIADPLTLLPLVRFDGVDDYLAFPRMSGVLTAFGVLRERPGADDQNARPWLADTTANGFGRGPDGLLYLQNVAAESAPSATFLEGQRVDPLVTRLPDRLVSLATRLGSATQVSTLSFDRQRRGGVWDGDFAEVLLYDRTLTDTEIAAVIEYLERKWALPQRFLHASFTLDEGSPTLLLTWPDGTRADALTLPPMPQDTAFGRPAGDPNSPGAFLAPSPGGPNPAAGLNRLAPDPVVEPPSGRYDTPIEVAIAPHDWPGPVFYTKDGSEPGAPFASPRDVVWMDDCLPEGATYLAEPPAPIEWVAMPSPASGGYSIRSPLGPGVHSDSIQGSQYPLAVRTGDRLFAHVYLDPAHPPREIMFQWQASHWEHRAFWGEDLIPYGASETAGRRRIGPLPEAGRWIRLEVPAAAVHLEDQSVTGFSVVLSEGRVWWDCVGRSTLHDGDSRLYTGPFPVSSNVVLRFTSTGPECLPSAIVTRHYWFDPPSTIPVVAVATPPEGLWSQTDGIFVMGTNAYPHPPYYGANFWAPWERRAQAEFFEPDGQRGFSQDVGLLVRGAWSRSSAQKSVEFEARRKYGSSNMRHRVFPDLEADVFDCLVLGQRGIVFHDPLVHSLMTGTALDVLAGRPAHLYLNGQYWGSYYLQEKINSTYLARHHGSEANPADLIEDGHDPKNGDARSLRELYNYVQRANLTTPEGYAGAAQRMDIDNFIDYQLIEIFADNRDWFGHNVMNWRPQHQGGVWRWLLKDVDWTFDMSGPGPENNTLARAVSCPPVGGALDCLLLRQLLTNTAFRHEFINRFADYLNTRFSTDAVIAHINAIADVLRPEALRQIQRWRAVPNLAWTPIQSLEEWEGLVESMRAFARARPDAVRRHLVDQFSLGGTVRIELDSETPVGGWIHLNSLAFSTEQMPWSGTYFQTVPLQVEAIPAPGYRFQGWLGRLETEPSLLLTPSLDTRLTPRFEPDPDYDPSHLRPTPHDLARGDFALSAWPSDSPAGSFPPHMLFLQTSVKDPGLTAEMTNEWTLPYNRGSRSRIIGLGEWGMCFLNTGDPQPEPGAGHLGAAVLALQTRGMSNVTVTWTAGTVQPNNRVYALRLQYRIDPKGEFRDVPDAQDQPVEYTRSPVVGDALIVGPTRLPAETSDQSLVQLRWKYYYVTTGASGARAALRLDDIRVTADGARVPLALLSWRAVAGHRVEGRFQAIPGELVRLMTSTDLFHWTPVRLLRATTEGEIRFEEPLAPQKTSQYYRLERVL